jgi:hypothetical protein
MNCNAPKVFSLKLKIIWNKRINYEVMKLYMAIDLSVSLLISVNIFSFMILAYI